MINKKLLLSILTGLTLYAANANAELFFSQDGNGNGLFEINVTTGAATLVGAGVSGVTSTTVGLAPSADPAVLFGSQPFALLTIQADGSSSTSLGGAVWEGLAYCSGNTTLYGAINGAFTSINQATGANIATLSAPGFDVEGIACDSASNIIYGIGSGNDNLIVYDIVGNSWSTVGDTGRSWSRSGLAWDSTGNILYAIETGTDSLYSINTTTGASTLIGPLGTNAGGGLAFVNAAAPVGPQGIPTLSLWGLLVAIFGLGFIGRRRVKK